VPRIKLPGIPRTVRVPPELVREQTGQLKSLLALIAAAPHGPGRPRKERSLAELLWLGQRRPGAHGPRRRFDDATLREWIDVIERAKIHFGVQTDREAVERIEEGLRQEAGATIYRRDARIKKILPQLARARSRLGLNLRSRRRGQKP